MKETGKECDKQEEKLLAGYGYCLKYLKGCLLEKKKIMFFAASQENVLSGNV